MFGNRQIVIQHLSFNIPNAASHEAYRNRCASGFASRLREILRDCLQNYQHFMMSKGNAKAQNITSNSSAESILITVESNWIQTKTVIWVVWFVSFVWLNKTNQIDQMNQTERA